MPVTAPLLVTDGDGLTAIIAPCCLPILHDDRRLERLGIQLRFLHKSGVYISTGEPR